MQLGVSYSDNAIVILVKILEMLMEKKSPKEIRRYVFECIQYLSNKPNVIQKTVLPGVADIDRQRQNIPMDVPISIGPKVVQAPSMMAILSRNPDLLEKIPDAAARPAAPELPMPEIIARTPEAAQALVKRQESISQAMSGIPEKGRTAPRKF